MHDSLRFLLPVQPTCDVHEATRFGDNQRGGFGRFQVADLSLKPFCRKLGMFHGKDSAEAATLFWVRQVHDLRAADVCQEEARLAVDFHPSQGMTSWMVSEHSVPARAEVGDAQLIDKILREFINPVSQSLGARQPVGIVLK